jgi:hypothetical protein
MQKHKISLNQKSKSIVALFGFVLSGIVLSLTKVFSNGFSTTHFYATLQTPPREMREIFGASDAGSYLSAAIQLDSFSRMSTDTLWVLNLWPPGMFTLEAALLRALPNDDWFGIALGGLTAVLWGSLLGYLAWLLSKLCGFVISACVLCISIAFGPIHDWILDSGLFYADGFGVYFLLLGIIFAISGLEVSRRTHSITLLAVLSGISFALAAYFRATYINLLYPLIFCTVIFTLLFFIKLAGETKISNVNLLKLLKPILFVSVALFSFFTLVNPWMNYLEKEVRGTREWSVVGDTFITGMWVDRELQPDFLQGVGWACTIDEKECLEIRTLQENFGAPNFVVKDDGVTGSNGVLSSKDLLRRGAITALTHPIEYVVDRFNFIGTAWNTSEIGQINYPLGLLLIGFVYFFFHRLIVDKESRRTIFIFVTFVYAVVFIPYLIGHIEIRYLLPFKLIPLLLPALLVSQGWHRRWSKL